MHLPTVVPDREYAASETLKLLIACHTAFANGFSGDALQALAAYQRATTNLSNRLEFVFSFEDVTKLVLTRRHWLLMDMALNEASGPVIHEVINAESIERERHLQKLVQEYAELSRAWANSGAKIVVADTNVFLHHEQYWDEIDWAGLAGAADVRLMIPMAVVRELDTHKRSDRKNHVSDTNREVLRARARVTVRRMRERLTDPGSVVSLQKPGSTAELLLDAEKHRPVEDADGEIINRALAVQRFTGRPVTLVTGDGAMQFTARTAGLEVISLYEAGH